VTATHGEWEPVADNAIPDELIRYGGLATLDHRDLFVIHAVLLRTGKVLMFSGHTEDMHYATVSFVFDPDTGSLTRIPFWPGMDLFCCHFVQLHTGQILAVGGSDIDYVTHSSVGANNLVVFDPTPTPGHPQGEWRPTTRRLNYGRWYPTAVLLGNGRVLVFSGRLGAADVPNPPADICEPVEVVDPVTFRARELTGATLELPIYPGLHLAPNGKVYYTHTNWGQEVDGPTTSALTVSGPTSGAWTQYPTNPAPPRREEGMSVLLPPAQDGKILLVGGSLALDAGGTPLVRQPPTVPFAGLGGPTDATSAQILDTSVDPPVWRLAAGAGSRTIHPRINGHLVLLPDATVFVCGGHNSYKWNAKPDTEPSLKAEIYTPSGAGAGFVEVAEMTDPRMYHSVALLMPDGRVLTAGGADANDSEPRLTTPPHSWPVGWPPELTWTAGTALNRKSRQFYKPPYFFKGSRPEITRLSRNGTRTARLPYGGTITVTTPQAASIRAVALMRPGAVTHHTDSEQRYVPLTFTRSGNDLTVTMLPATQANTAPPGFYMLWIVDDQRRPCQRARFVHVPLPGGAP
jgi:hypothetical protein